MGKLPGRPLMTIVKLTSFLYLHLEKKIMFHKGFLNLSLFKFCFVTRSKKKKKMRPYSGVTAGEDGVGQLPGRP